MRKQPLVAHTQTPWMVWSEPTCGPCKTTLEKHNDYLGQCWVCPACLTRWDRVENSYLGETYEQRVGLDSSVPVLDVDDPRAEVLQGLVTLEEQIESPYTPEAVRAVLEDRFLDLLRGLHG